MNSWWNRQLFTTDFQSTVLGSGKHFPLERKVLNAALFASAAVALILVFTTAFFPINKLGIFIALGGTLIFATFYAIGRRRRESKWLAWTYLVVMYGIVLVDWRYSAGIDGVSPFLIIAFTGITPLILRPRERLAGFLLAVIVVVIIYLATSTSMETIPQHHLSSSLLRNKIAGIIAIAGGLSLVSLLVINSYRRDRDEILMLNRSLEDLNERVEERNAKLEMALDEIKILRGIIPICSSCKKIRDDKGYWSQIESYIQEHSEADFSHGICPECAEELYPGMGPSKTS